MALGVMKSIVSSARRLQSPEYALLIKPWYMSYNNIAAYILFCDFREDSSDFVICHHLVLKTGISVGIICYRLGALFFITHAMLFLHSS